MAPLKQCFTYPFDIAVKLSMCSFGVQNGSCLYAPAWAYVGEKEDMHNYVYLCSKLIACLQI